MYDYKDKKLNIRQLNDYMLNRSLRMFEYENLPDTIPALELEKLLQINGYAFFVEIDNNYYVVNGGLGGELDIYKNPTEIIISEPSLNFNKTLKLDDGVMIKSDDMSKGLFKLFQRYNYILNENEITMIINQFNNRIPTIITAGDDKTRESAEIYLDKVVNGELGIIGENRIFDGIKAQTTQANSNNYISQLVEFHQYIKASMYNDIGVNMNYNMKRERLVSNEVEMNTEHLHTLVDNMLINRQEAIAKINEKFDLDISVQFGGLWKKKPLPTMELEDSNNEIPQEIIESDELNVDSSEDIQEELGEDVVRLEIDLTAESIEEIAESIEEIVDEIVEELEEEEVVADDDV